MSNAVKIFSATFPQLTRPANATPYSVNDSISDNGTAGSVTAIPVGVADTFDQPICIEEVLVDTNDTGLAAGCSIRVHLFRSDPTANSGVGGGDNAAWSNKKAGWVGSLTGVFTAFSDGGRARCVPDAGSYILCHPSDGGSKLWVQFQALTAFTPSANSTTLLATVRGFQGRA